MSAARRPGPRSRREPVSAARPGGEAPGASVLLVGFHAVGARLRNAPRTIETLYFDEGRRDARMRDLLQLAAAASVRCVAAAPERLRGLTQAIHQGVVARAAARAAGVDFDEVLRHCGPDTLLLLLDGVTDPRNLGACLRTAAGAGVDAVIVPRDRAAPLNEVAAKAAAGAAEALPFVAVTNLARAMQQLQDAGVWIVGADAAAERSIFELDLRGPRAWALGAEGSGLRRLTRERCDELARIPLTGSVESLNVSVATGICLFETVRQRLELPHAGISR